MTRINCVPVQELTDKHLLAEYRELPRISGLIWKWYDKTAKSIMEMTTFVMPTVPDTYRLGEGHCIFFYDKGEYLRKRFEEQIVPEMLRRGFTINYKIYRMHPIGCNNDWLPDEKATEINRRRIQERLEKVS